MSPHRNPRWLKGVDHLRLNRIRWLVAGLLCVSVLTVPIKLVLRRYVVISPGGEAALLMLAYLSWMAALLVLSTALVDRRAGRLMATAVVALALLMVVAFLTLHA